MPRLCPISSGPRNEWFVQGVSLSLKGVVQKLKTLGMPQGLKISPLLRNCFALLLDHKDDGRRIRPCGLNDELGLVYEAKET